ncbi:MAG: histidine kinase [Saprospiraceae bacterium]|nr:histidine kinase [Saprospiraceae bacterium]
MHAQLFSEYNFKFKNYTAKDGLPHDKVNKVAQDSKGFLWLATEGGLSRFDGFSFKNYHKNENRSSAMTSDNLVDIAIDSKDRLWLAFDHGYCSFDPYSCQFQKYSYKGKNIACQKLIYDPATRRIYLASRDDGLYFVEEKSGLVKSTSLSQQLPHNVTSLYIDSKGFLWMTIERHGFYKYRYQEDKSTYSGGNEWLMFIKEDVKRKQFYTGRWLGEFIPFDGQSLPADDKRYVIAKFEGYEKCVYTDSDFAPKITGDHIIWVSSHRGLGLFDLQKNQFVKHLFYDPSQLDGIGSNWLMDIFVSRDGSVWISSWNGLHNVNPQAQSFSKHYIPELDINLYNLISGIVDDPHDPNKVWMTANGTGVIEWDKKTEKIKKYYFKDILKPRDFNYEKRWPHHIHTAKNGVLWIGSYGGFAKIKNGVVSFVDTWIDGYATYANDSYQDKEGVLWLAGRHLIRFDPNTEKHRAFYFPDGYGYDMFKDNFFAITDGPGRKLLVGTALGLFEFDKVAYKFKHLPLHFNNVDDRILNNVRALYCTGHKLFIGTYVGLYCLNLQTGKMEKLVDGFVEIKGMMADPQGNLWVYIANGLYKINPNDLSWQRYDQNDGMYTLSTDPVSMFIYNGQMNIGHRSLFTSFDPKTLGQNNNVPEVYITEVTALDREYTSSANTTLILPQHQSDVSFAFTALEYAAPTKLTFSYILQGFDKVWSPYSTSRFKNYTQLPPGNYVFKVRAKNIIGLTSQKIATFTFVVKPAFWQTWWFKSLSALVLVAGLYAWYHIRIDGIRNRAEEKNKFDKMMAELDEKLLRSQMNPHFIFNSLNSIQKYIWESKEELAAEYLASFAKLMRAILENSRKEYVSLEEEFKILKLYIDLEHRRSNGKFEYQLQLDPSLDATKVKILPLILQPFIENAIWHGLGKKEEGGFLLVNICQKDEHNMEVVIEDNGVGRKKETAIQSDSNPLGQSITQQRLEKLMEVSRKNAEVQIIDLFDQQGKAAGTRVVLCLPIIE